MIKGQGRHNQNITEYMRLRSRPIRTCFMMLVVRPFSR